MSKQDISNFIDKFVSDDSNFNPGQTPDQKKVGAALALNTLTIAETQNTMGLGSDELRQVGGDAMKAARAGDGEELRSVLEGAGGNLGDLTNDQLLAMYNQNAHLNNHAILNVDSGVFKGTHQTSIGREGAPEGEGLTWSNDKQDYVEKVNGTVDGAIDLFRQSIQEYALF